MIALKENLRKFPVTFEILRKIYRFVLPVPLSEKLFELSRSVYRLFIPVPVPENPIQTRVRELQTHIKKAFRRRTPVFFLQVGSNDGLRYDPLHPFIVNNKNWTGIFVEPVDLMFQRLQKNYDFSERFIFENVAIGSTTETRKFYYVSENAKELGDSVSSWYDQIGSFDKAHLLKHCTGRNSRLEPYIVEQEVKCVRLQDILDKHRVKKIDLIHIDAEGFDYEVLSQIDFKKYKPSIVIYEHYHLSVDEKLKAESILQTHGYTVTELEEDTLALLRAF